MAKKKIPLIAAAFAALVMVATSAPASAGTQHLKCHNGFSKTAIYTNSVKCQRIARTYFTRAAANRAATNWANNASCNAHYNAPTKSVSQTNYGKWVAKVHFICAIIY